jgi:hypothetical protein
MRYGIPALAALVLVAGAVRAAEPRIAKLVAYDTGSYTIVTSRGGAQARKFIEDLVKFRITLEKVLGKRATPNPSPTHIVIVGKADWEKYLQPRENIAGFFQPARFANYMAMNGDVDAAFATPLMFHEYTHYYLASQFSGEYPPWFNEGLAELMGFAMFTDQGMAVLRIPMHRVFEARDRDWIKFERLIKVDHYSPEYQSHQLASAFYAQSWLTLHYGFVENRDFGRRVLTYLNALNTLTPQPEASRTAFGEDLEVVDQQLREYARKSSRSSGAFPLGEVPKTELPAGKPVAENDAYAIIINLMLEARRSPDRIRPLVAALARREPAAARTAIFEARLAVLDNDDAKFTQAVDKGLGALTDGDWLARRELAGVLLTSAMDFSPLSQRTTEDSERDLKRALKLYGEAVAHNNGDIEALWGFGTAASRLDQHLDLANDALVAAYRRAPSNVEIAMSLANLKGRNQEPDEMIVYLKDVIRYATDLHMRKWAVETLEQMQKYVAERDRIEAENKERREAWEKRVAEAEKKRKSPAKKAKP